MTENFEKDVFKALYNRHLALLNIAETMGKAVRDFDEFPQEGFLPIFEKDGARFVRDAKLYEWINTARKEVEWTKKRAAVYCILNYAENLENLKAEMQKQAENIKTAITALESAAETGAFGECDDYLDEIASIGAALTETEIILEIIDGKTGTTVITKGESDSGNVELDDPGDDD